MKAEDLIVRCLGWKDHDLWIVMCLDYDLVAQDSSLPKATARLEAQIRDYVKEAVSVDREHAPYLLLRRKAPLAYRLKFRLAGLVHMWKNLRGFEIPLPLCPAAK